MNNVTMPVLLLLILPAVLCNWVEDLNLPPKLLEYTIRNDAELRKKCEEGDCPVDVSTLSNDRCWGYEANCSYENSYSSELGVPSCKSLTKRGKFFKQADFGYLRERSRMHDICLSSREEGSRLTCSDDLRHCHGTNIFFNFKSWDHKNSKRYREDIVQPGEVGGNCEEFHAQVLEENMDEKGYLRSWADEFKHFSSLPTFSIDKKHCDVIFERPTIVIKLDASINMYHHFCDFINLYASQHINGSFSRQVDVVWWDTFSGGFVDAFFGITWTVFTEAKPVELIALAGRRVCFKNALFPLLARQRFGLYYNMPLEEGCFGSGLVHAFAHHILHRLNITQIGPLLDEVRLTILTRSTQFRRILNLDELLNAVQEIRGLTVKVVDYNGHIPFLNQLNSTHNSDIFIGMHGAGLTHLLFLPDWAAIMELYNCEDRNCYKDLARLRGVKYFTWSSSKENLVYPEDSGRHPSTGAPHKKFTNYRFDPSEFKRQVNLMVEYVRRHPKFVEERRRLRRVRKREEL